MKFLKYDAKNGSLPPVLSIWEVGIKSKVSGNKLPRSESWLSHLLDGKTWRNLAPREGEDVLLQYLGLGREGSS